MNWFNNLCSCIGPNLRQNIIGYLNSTNLNREVIEEEKVTEQTRNPGQDYEPEHNIYSFAKSKSVNFMKLQQNSDEGSDQQDNQTKNKKRKRIFQKNNNQTNAHTNSNQNSNEQENEMQQNDQIMDVFWYPRPDKNKTRDEQFSNLLKHKRRIFDIIMQQQPSSMQYDKVYDSLDQTNLTVYCKLESLLKGRKINSYRFSFKISGVDLNTYQKWIHQVDPKQILPLLQQMKSVSSSSNEADYMVSHSFWKKLLVISPQDLVTVHKVYGIQQKQQKYLPTIIFSVKQDETKDNRVEGYNRTWLHLNGIQALQIEDGLKICGYLCFDVDLSVSPNMLKQPISKQIRVFAQKMICNIKKSDGI